MQHEMQMLAASRSIGVWASLVGGGVCRRNAHSLVGVPICSAKAFEKRPDGIFVAADDESVNGAAALGAASRH